jgi:hypothetical protein
MFPKCSQKRLNWLAAENRALKKPLNKAVFMAGAKGLEPSTYGFGVRFLAFYSFS